MAFGYPVFLELAGRRCVVIGSGAVSDGKVEQLLEAGADDILVVATSPIARLDDLGHDDRVRVARRAWKPEDLDGAFLCIGWSADQAERDAVAYEARVRRVLTNVVDDIPNCDWAAAAQVRRGALVLAIGTGGSSPALARKLREELGDRFGEEWIGVVAILGDVRRETLPLLPDFRERVRRWQAALDLDADRWRPGQEMHERGGTSHAGIESGAMMPSAPPSSAREMECGALSGTRTRQVSPSAKAASEIRPAVSIEKLECSRST
jgi:precorrin-2 dehydrogenase/sirohydrochlorin ferrochelatase